MNIDQAFPSKYLKAADVGETDLALTIKKVVIETVGQGEDAEEKPIVYFDETEKGLVLNKTNTNTIKGLYSVETDNWMGKTIAIFATEVDFAGKQTMALRVRMRAPIKTSGPSVEALKERYFNRANEAAQLGIVADTIPDDATAETITELGKKLKAAIDKANEF